MADKLRRKWICKQIGGQLALIDVDDLGASSTTHSVIEDSMEPTMHPCTGEMIDSKRKFSAITKAHGCVEVGNEWKDKRFHPGDKPIAGRRKAVEEAYRMYKEGYRAPVQNESQAIAELGAIRRWK